MSLTSRFAQGVDGMSNAVSEIGGLNLKGNVVDHEWFTRITFSNGKPHIVAIMVLSEIVYWYRPTVIRDEINGKVTYKKNSRLINYKRIINSWLILLDLQSYK